jgi:hypothetical protein
MCWSFNSPLCLVREKTIQCEKPSVDGKARYCHMEGCFCLAGFAARAAKYLFDALSTLARVSEHFAGIFQPESALLTQASLLKSVLDHRNVTQLSLFTVPAALWTVSGR